MKVGTFGGQIEALRREVRNIEKEERQRGNRRAFLGALGGLATGAVAGFGLQGGAKPASATEKKDAGKRDEKDLAAVPHPLATSAMGTRDELLAARWRIIEAARQTPDHDILKMGLTRLFHVAIEGSDRPAKALAAYLLALDSTALPNNFALLRKTLRKEHEARRAK